MQIVSCPQCQTKNRVDPQAAAGQIAKCGKCGTPLDLNREPVKASDGKPVTVTDATFEQVLSNAGGKPVLVDAWAPWCGPCRMVGPIMEQLAKEADGRYLVGKLNVDDNPQTASRFQIVSIPTMLIFKNGQLVDRLIGAQPKQAIAERLAKAA